MARKVTIPNKSESTPQQPRGSAQGRGVPDGGTVDLPDIGGFAAGDQRTAGQGAVSNNPNVAGQGRAKTRSKNPTGGANPTVRGDKPDPGPTIEIVRDPSTMDNYDPLVPMGSVDALSEIGITGLNRVSGFVYEELLPELRGTRGRRQIRMMLDEDPIIGAILYTIEMLCRQVKWDVEAASESNEDEKAAEFLKGILFEDMSHTWQDTLSEILQFLPWGYSYIEIVYKLRNGEEPGSYVDGNGIKREYAESTYDDGKIGIRKPSPRAQETMFRWQFDDRGGVKAMIQLAPPYFRFTEIPIEKALLFRTTSRKNNPEGRSVLRNAYSSWYYKRSIQRIEAIGIERDLAGLPIAWMPPVYLSPDATPSQAGMARAMKQFVINVRRDEQEGAVLPLAYDKDGHKLFDFSLLNSGGARSFDTDKIVQRYDQRMAQSLMAEFVMLGMQSVGSFALASSKTNLFAVGLGTFLDMICDVINRHLIKRIFSLNGMKMAKRPKIIHGDIENIPLDELAQYITALSGSGLLFPNTDLQKYLLEIAGMPAAQEMAEVGQEDYDPAALAKWAQMEMQKQQQDAASGDAGDGGTSAQGQGSDQGAAGPQQESSGGNGPTQAGEWFEMSDEEQNKVRIDEIETWLGDMTPSDFRRLDEYVHKQSEVSTNGRH